MLEKFVVGAIVAFIVCVTPYLYKLGKEKKQESIKKGKVYYGLLGCRILGLFVLGTITAEMILMILLGDKIEGAIALLLLLVAGLVVTVIYVAIYTKSFQRKYLDYSTEEMEHNSSSDGMFKSDTISNNVNSKPIFNSNIQVSLSSANEVPTKKSGQIYGSDIALQPKEQQVQKFPVDAIANGLAEVCIKEIVDVMGICAKYQVPYNQKKLIISTFSYFYSVWIVNFGNITVKQGEEIEEIYRNRFSDYNRKQFEDKPYKEVLENEEFFRDQLKRVDRRVLSSYQSNSGTFVDDGISDEYILEFIDNQEDKEKIKMEIVVKVLKDWASVAQRAGKQSTIE